MFDYRAVTALPTSDRILDLQQRVQRMQGSAVTRTLDTLPGLGAVIQLKTGGAYSVSSPALAMALMAGPSRAGDWTAVVGVPDFGLEAAADYGVDLDRTIVVPDPGEHWLSVTAGLVDVVTLILVRPPEKVSDHQAERLRSRLRQKDAALICLGSWPRSDANATITSSSWTGVGRGHGRLSGREVVVRVTRSGLPPVSVPLWLPAADLRVAERSEPTVTLSAVQAG